MGIPEYKEAIKFMLKKYKGKKQFVVKVQTGKVEVLLYSINNAIIIFLFFH